VLKTEQVKKYIHLFFDLDHTLWDYERNTLETLHELYDHYRFSNLQTFTADDFLQAFRQVNAGLWHDFNEKKLDKDNLRERRFRNVLSLLGSADVPEDLDHRFLSICPNKPHLVANAVEVLDRLRDHYQMHIITNGFDDVQYLKIKASGLSDYFPKIITSDSAGYRKPEVEFFEHALEIAGASKEDSLVIGDNLVTDIGGALSAGIDCVFFNPNATSSDLAPTHTIADLRELLHILPDTLPTGSNA
jgi:putative hydrolase of the HAD superfamily